MAPRQAADLLDLRAVGRSAREDDLRPQFVLHPVADRSKAVGGPEAPGAAAPGMEDKRHSPGPDVAPPVGDVGLARDESHLAGRYGDPGGPERLEVVFGDGPVLVFRRRVMDHVRVERPQLERVRAVVERHPHGRPAQARDRSGLLRVVDVEDMREFGLPDPRREAGPVEGPRRERHRLVHVGIQRKDARVGGLDQRDNAGIRPEEPQIPEKRPQEHHVAQVPAADDEYLRGLGHGTAYCAPPWNAQPLRRRNAIARQPYFQTASVLWRS